MTPDTSVVTPYLVGGLGSDIPSEARWERERVNFSAHVRVSAVPLGSMIIGPGCMLGERMH